LACSRSAALAGARALTAAAALAGVERQVLLSIVNVDQSDFGYYRAKTEQERIYLGAQVDARVVRATQFHDFVATFCHLAPFGVATALAGIRFQPIAVEDVARAPGDGYRSDGSAHGCRRRSSGPVASEPWPSRSGSRAVTVVGRRLCP